MDLFEAIKQGETPHLSTRSLLAGLPRGVRGSALTREGLHLLNRFLSEEKPQNLFRESGGYVKEGHLNIAVALARFSHEKEGSRITADEMVAGWLHDSLEGVDAATFEKRVREISALGKFKDGWKVLPMVLLMTRPPLEDMQGRKRLSRRQLKQVADKYYVERFYNPLMKFGRAYSEILRGHFLAYHPQGRPTAAEWRELAKKGRRLKTSDNTSNFLSALVPEEKKAGYIRKSAHLDPLAEEFASLRDLRHEAIRRWRAGETKLPAQWAGFVRRKGLVQPRMQYTSKSGLSVMEGPLGALIVWPQVPGKKSLFRYLPDNWGSFKTYRGAGSPDLPPLRNNIGVTIGHGPAGWQRFVVKQVRDPSRFLWEPAVLHYLRNKSRRTNRTAEEPFAMFITYSTRKPETYLYVRPAPGDWTQSDEDFFDVSNWIEGLGLQLRPGVTFAKNRNLFTEEAPEGSKFHTIVGVDLFDPHPSIPGIQRAIMRNLPNASEIERLVKYYSKLKPVSPEERTAPTLRALRMLKARKRPQAPR